MKLKLIIIEKLEYDYWDPEIEIIIFNVVPTSLIFDREVVKSLRIPSNATLLSFTLQFSWSGKIPSSYIAITLFPSPLTSFIGRCRA